VRANKYEVIARKTKMSDNKLLHIHRKSPSIPPATSSKATTPLLSQENASRIESIESDVSKMKEGKLPTPNTKGNTLGNTLGNTEGNTIGNTLSNDPSPKTRVTPSLVLDLIMILIVVAGIFVFLYFGYEISVINHRIDVLVEALSKSFPPIGNKIH
jgi:hypothetical protein